MTLLTYLDIDTKRPVAFLDLCGVIADTYLTRPGGISRLENNRRFTLTHPDYRGDVISIPMWQWLKSIFLHYKVQVVIVSSWLSSNLPEDHPRVQQLKDFFGYDDIKGSLVTCGGFERGNAIKAFVEHHQLVEWLVIDDSRDQMYEDKTFFNNRRFVHPHGRYGVGPKELEQIDYLFGQYVVDFQEQLFKLKGIPLWK